MKNELVKVLGAALVGMVIGAGIELEKRYKRDSYVSKSGVDEIKRALTGIIETNKRVLDDNKIYLPTIVMSKEIPDDSHAIYSACYCKEEYINKDNYVIMYEDTCSSNVIVFSPIAFSYSCTAKGIARQIIKHTIDYRLTCDGIVDSKTVNIITKRVLSQMKFR